MLIFEEMYNYLSDAVIDSLHVLLRRQDISLALNLLTAAQLHCGELYLQALEAEALKAPLCKGSYQPQAD